jgi:hypothetical protein
LALGLKKETADMCWTKVGTKSRTFYVPELAPINMVSWRHTPAWSLHRLLCLYGLDYTIKEVYNNAEECYGMLICAIEIAIENGDFNEEYLNKEE